MHGLIFKAQDIRPQSSSAATALKAYSHTSRSPRQLPITLTRHRGNLILSRLEHKRTIYSIISTKKHQTGYTMWIGQ